jgi:SAM-dependent methyltransferase
MNELASLLEPAKIVGRRGRILLTDLQIQEELEVSQKAWESIYHMNLDQLRQDRLEFAQSKLADHLAVIGRFTNFSKNAVYLEIGCGPAYIAEYLMEQFDVAFIGMDFNLEILETLQAYLDGRGFTNYLLVHAEINTMPLRDATVDFIYGGGVIEHFANTRQILIESKRILKAGGILFNTVPAFNLSWLPLRLYNNIPAVPWLRSAFTYLHMNLLQGRVLERNYGFELSFTKKGLASLHREAGFRRPRVGPFPIHPSPTRLRNPRLRRLVYRLFAQPLLAPVYYAAARK